MCVEKKCLITAFSCLFFYFILLLPLPFSLVVFSICSSLKSQFMLSTYFNLNKCIFFRAQIWHKFILFSCFLSTFIEILAIGDQHMAMRIKWFCTFACNKFIPFFPLQILSSFKSDQHHTNKNWPFFCWIMILYVCISVYSHFDTVNSWILCIRKQRNHTIYLLLFYQTMVLLYR